MHQSLLQEVNEEFETEEASVIITSFMIISLRRKSSVVHNVSVLVASSE